MLTDFYMDDNIFTDDSLKTITVVNDVLIQAWMDYGRLAYSPQCNPMKIVQAAPPEFRKSWATHLSYCCNRTFDIEPDDLLMQETWDGVIQRLTGTDVSSYVLAKGYHSQILGKVFYRQCQNTAIEVFTPSETTASVFYKSGKRASEEDLTEGALIQDVWKNKFKGLAKYSKKISIIDRYLAINLCQDVGKLRFTAIEKFIELLAHDSMSESTHIVIYSSDVVFADNTYRKIDIDNYLRDVLRKKPYMGNKFSIEINICNDALFKRLGHDRYIAFDNHVVEIGVGMEIFRDSQIKTTQFTIKNGIKAGFGQIIRHFMNSIMHKCKMA